VTTPEGVGRVGDVDVLRERVRVYFEDQPPKIFAASDVRLLGPPAEAPPGGPPSAPPEPEPDHGAPPDDASHE